MPNSCFLSLSQVHGYFKGMSYPLLAAGALNSLFFGVYGVTLRFLQENRDASCTKKKVSVGGAGSDSASKPTYGDIFWAGCAGGVAQLVVACPVEVVKIKLQTQTDERRARFHGPYDVLKQIYRQQGIRGWYQGLVVMAWRSVSICTRNARI